MIMGLVGMTPLFASPINCGAFAMVASLIIVPLVSIITKSVDFDINPPHVEGAIDREFQASLGGEEEFNSEAILETL